MNRFKHLLSGFVVACGVLLGGTTAQAAGPLVIGSTNFPEQLILAHIYADVLQSRGIPVKLRLNLGSREVVFPALKSGELDLLPEYSGSMLEYLTNGKSTAVKPKAVDRAVRNALPSDLAMLKPSSAQDKDAFVVRAQTAQRYHLKTLSDLKGVAPKLILGGPPELKTRRVGVPGLRQVYGVQFKQMRSLDAGGPLTEAALKGGSIDVGIFFTTQGIIEANGWRILRDDRQLIAAQNLVPVVRKKALTPRIRKTLNAISARLTTRALRHMNREVSIDKRDPGQVATQWARTSGLLSQRDSDDAPNKAGAGN